MTEEEKRNERERYDIIRRRGVYIDGTIRRPEGKMYEGRALRVQDNRISARGIARLNAMLLAIEIAGCAYVAWLIYRVMNG